MKKSVLRVGLLVLTLALLLGALTLTAGATGSTIPTNQKLSVTPGETELFLEPGQHLAYTSITVQVPTEYELVDGPNFSSKSVVNLGNGYTFFAYNADTYKIDVTAKCKLKNDPTGTGSTVDLAGSCTIEVKNSQVVSAEITGSETVAVGKSSPSYVEFDPREATGYIDITWSSSDEDIARVNSSGVVTGVTAGGPVTITAKLKAEPGYILENDTLEYSITVTGECTVDKRSHIHLYAGPGPSAPPTLTVWDEDGNRERDFDVVWTSDKTSIVSVNSAGKLVPHKKGNATLTAEVTVNGETVRTDCRVDVENDEIRFSSFQLEEGDTETLSASLKSGVTSGVTFTFESSDNSGLYIGKSFYSTKYTAEAKECGVYTITVEATLPDGETKLETDVKVSVYRDEDIDVTLAEADDFDFDQKDVFSAVKAGGYTYPTRDLDDLRMYDLLLDGCYNSAETYTIDPTRQSNPAGSLSGITTSKRSISYLDDVRFTHKTNGGDNLAVVYYIYGDDELLLKTGTLTISTDGTSRDITYETDNSTDVRCKGDDCEGKSERETGEDADTM